MGRRRYEKTLRWLNKHVGPMVKAQILAGDSFIPEGGELRQNGTEAAAALLGGTVSGMAAHARRGRDHMAEAMADAHASPGTAAEMFPKTNAYVVVTASDLFVVGLNHVTGKPVAVMALYSLPDVTGIRQVKAGLTHQRAELTFIDGSTVILKSPRGGGYYPQDTVPRMDEAIQQQRQSLRHGS